MKARQKQKEKDQKAAPSTEASSEAKMTKSQKRLHDQRVAKEHDKAVNEELVKKFDGNLQYSDDSSDEEVLLRTGDVPREWYELYDHAGYSVTGEAVKKMPQSDELTKFIERQNDPMWWSKITDFLNNKEVKLSKGDLELLKRVRDGQYADSEIDPYADFDYDADDKHFVHPLNSAPESKRRFIPSKWERLKVSKYVQALKKGWMKTLAEKA